jgi:hypothetical protein
MLKKIVFLLLFLTLNNFSAGIKMQGISIFEELQDSISPCMDKTVYHKKWNEYLLYVNNLNEKSVIEQLFDEKWIICGPQGDGFSMNISAIKWDDTGKGYNKKSWQINTQGSITKAETDFDGGGNLILSTTQLRVCLKRFFFVRCG